MLSTEYPLFVNKKVDNCHRNDKLSTKKSFSITLSFFLSALLPIGLFLMALAPKAQQNQRKQCAHNDVDILEFKQRSGALLLCLHIDRAEHQDHDQNIGNHGAMFLEEFDLPHPHSLYSNVIIIAYSPPPPPAAVPRPHGGGHMV